MTVLGINITSSEPEIGWEAIGPTTHPVNLLNEKCEKLWKARDVIIDARCDYYYYARSSEFASNLLQSAINHLAEAAHCWQYDKDEAKGILLIKAALGKLWDAREAHWQDFNQLCRLLEDLTGWRCADVLRELIGEPVEEEQYPKSNWDVM